ncbi:transposase [Micromonospora matsumotoense]|uniref:transposase n=1 Tax=Micromonospora matsumotoense TaxID=121616 RepID=UPI0033D7A171
MSVDGHPFNQLAGEWSELCARQVRDWDATLEQMIADEAALMAGRRWRSGPATLLEMLGLNRNEVVMMRTLSWLLKPGMQHGLGDLVSWTKLSPRTMQSGPKTRRGPTGRGSPYLKSVLGDAAAAAARTDTFLGERYRRLVKRRGKAKALVAIARSILTIAWHILADPITRFIDLGVDHYITHINKHRKTHSLIRQLEALGHTVQLNPA